MHVLIVTHYFPPEVGAPQARLSEMARHWASAGEQVTVLTGMPSHPTGVLPPEYRSAARRIEIVDGYRVVRTWIYATANEGLLKKTLCHLSFALSSVLLGWRKTGRVNLVIVSSPTFLSIGAAWFLAKAKRARLIVEVRDLWPGIFVELGILTNHRLIRALERLELAAYRAADAVVVVTHGFRDDIVRRGIRTDKVHVISNGVDLDRFRRSNVVDLELRQHMGGRVGDTLVLYLGAHGISQALSTVIDAAAMLVDESVHFVLVGDGADKLRLIARVHALQLRNVTMLSSVPRDVVPALLGTADICLALLRDVPLFSTFVPSKIFEYLGAGRAVIGSVKGEPRRILEDAGALVVPPEAPGELAAAIRRLAAAPDEREQMGCLGRQYVTEHFDRAALADQYRQLIQQLAGA